MRIKKIFLSITFILLTSSSLCWGENLHLIDSLPNGFALYRSGMPTQEDFNDWCKLGITQVWVLSGNAEKYEGAYKESCPKLKVGLNILQDERVPLTRAFLRQFDDWIENARLKGRKVLFRCDCGCHRTGRLAAYYEMKYLKTTPEHAIDHMITLGKDMEDRKFLDNQVLGLRDVIENRACTVSPEHCPI